jgi:hypothetical protein
MSIVSLLQCNTKRDGLNLLNNVGKYCENEQIISLVRGFNTGCFSSCTRTWTSCAACYERTISFNGNRIVNLVPGPISESTRKLPPKRSFTDATTASIPTPRPEISFTSLFVEKPGRKIRAINSSLDRDSASCSEMILIR